MNEIYARYGYFLDKLDSFTLTGIDGVQKIGKIMEEMRGKGTSLINGIVKVYDYEKGIDNLPKSDVLKFVFVDGSWIAIRPSGTEPNIKVYYSVKGNDRAHDEEALETRRAVINKIING